MLDKTRTPRRTAEQWLSIVEQQKISGHNGAEFCRAQDITYQSFMNWRKKLSQAY